MTSRHTIALEDANLAATLYEAKGNASDAIILINSAMGMPRDFYAPLAEWLAAHGIDTVCWDYRGMGESDAHGEVQIHNWGERDLPAMIDWLQITFPQRRLVIIAHSVGGQILGMTMRTNQADKLVLIGSQSGYWRLWSGRQQLRIGFIWHVVIPLVTRLAGRIPARWFGLTEDLPAGVAKQWALWGRDPDYLMGRHRRPSADNYARIARPLLNVWISDDDIASRAANRRMTTWYANARIENLDLHPADLGTDRIGHFRLFRETIGPKFWPQLLEWIRRKN